MKSFLSASENAVPLPAVEALLALPSNAYAAQPFGGSAVSARILKALGSSSSLLK